MIVNLRKRILELEAQVKILEMNVRDESAAKYEAMKNSANQITRVTPKT